MVTDELPQLQLRKETVVAYFKFFYRLPRGSEDSHKNLTYQSRSRGQYLNPGPPEQEEGVTFEWCQFMSYRTFPVRYNANSSGRQHCL